MDLTYHPTCVILRPIKYHPVRPEMGQSKQTPMPETVEAVKAAPETVEAVKDVGESEGKAIRQ